MKPAKPFSNLICTAIVFTSLPTLAFAGDWENSGSSWGNSNQNNNPQNTTPVGKLMEEIRQIEANIDKEKTAIQDTQAEIEQLNNELNQLKTDSTYIQALQQENTDLRALRDQLVVEYPMQAKNSPEQAINTAASSKRKSIINPKDDAIFIMPNRQFIEPSSKNPLPANSTMKTMNGKLWLVYDSEPEGGAQSITVRLNKEYSPNQVIALEYKFQAITDVDATGSYSEYQYQFGNMTDHENEMTIDFTIVQTGNNCVIDQETDTDYICTETNNTYHFLTDINTGAIVAIYPENIKNYQDNYTCHLTWDKENWIYQCANRDPQLHPKSNGGFYENSEIFVEDGDDVTTVYPFYYLKAGRYSQLLIQNKDWIDQPIATKQTASAAQNSFVTVTTKSEKTKISSNGTTQQTIENVTIEEKTSITLMPNTSSVHFEASAGAVIPFVPYAKVYKNNTPVSYRSIAAAGMINLGVRLKYVNILIEQHFGKTYYIGDKYNSFFNGGYNTGENSGDYFASYLTVGGIIPTSPNFDLRISAGFGAIYGSTATLPEVSSTEVFSFKTGFGGDYIWDSGFKFGFNISYAMAYFTKTAERKGQKLLNYIVPALYIGYIY